MKWKIMTHFHFHLTIVPKKTRISEM